MVFSSMKTAVELEFSRTRLCSVQAAKMERSHHINWNSKIYRKGAIRGAEIERSFLAGKGFNTNLVQFLPLYVINSNKHVC